MKYLIKDTTREERIEIIKNSLGEEDSCESVASGCMGGGDPYKMFEEYIDGKKEIAEINMEYNTRYLNG